jgi:hypothetical protein
MSTGSPCLSTRLIHSPVRHNQPSSPCGCGPKAHRSRNLCLARMRTQAVHGEGHPLHTPVQQHRTTSAREIAMGKRPKVPTRPCGIPKEGRLTAPAATTTAPGKTTGNVRARAMEAFGRHGWAVSKGVPGRPLQAVPHLESGCTAVHPLHDCPRCAGQLARSTMRPRLGCRACTLRALRCWGDGVCWGRGEIEELLRQRGHEVVDDRLHRHESGRPPLLVHDGDMPVGAAIHLV